MVHNGIEYGAMAAYAEGLNLIHAAAAGIKQSNRCRRSRGDQSNDFD
jgi:6-phosphogluconate dehydrogenase (decarboxylating)